jgi:hypothetical protein
MTDTIWGDLRLTIEGRKCRCGGDVMHVCAGDGGRRELKCEACGSHRGLLSNESADFVLRVCRGFGAPTTPIILRRTKTCTTI